MRMDAELSHAACYMSVSRQGNATLVHCLPCMSLYQGGRDKMLQVRQPL